MKHLFSGLLALFLLAGCGGSDNKETWFQDLDGDSYGNVNVRVRVSVASQSKPAGFARIAGDCDDNDALINPEAEEIPLNAVDEDCDGLDLLALYIDADSDGFGDENATPVFDTSTQAGLVINNLDCDDSPATGFAINPDAVEVNDQIDNNCDGVLNDGPFAVGDYGPAGGIVFYLSGDSGLEAAPVDQDIDARVQWGCPNIDIPGATGAAIGTGAQNTAAIIAANCSEATTAAKLAVAYSLNGHQVWFLPSLDELRTLFTQKNRVGNFLPDPATPVYYWNSTQRTDNLVLTKAFNTGFEKDFVKSQPLRVRVIRAF